MPIGIYKRLGVIERFMNFIEFEPNTGCWIWTGYCSKNGYGQFGLGSKRNNTNKTVKASRFSYEIFVGQIPEGVEVLHKCDFPPCVNPDHFFLGTGQDNMNDMSLKRRGSKSKTGLPYGVSIQSNGRFLSRIWFEGKQTCLGTFDTPEEAGEVALKKKLKLLIGNT